MERTDDPIVRVFDGDRILAIIIRSTFHKKGIDFLTEEDAIQQLAYMSHPAGHIVPAHTHNNVKRVIIGTPEALFVRKGKVKIDIYTSKGELLDSHVVESGDVIMLADGGHGLTMLEDAELIEIKQGPYAGKGDKTKFMES